jgi:hypothetical protein
MLWESVMKARIMRDETRGVGWVEVVVVARVVSRHTFTAILNCFRESAVHRSF